MNKADWTAYERNLDNFRYGEINSAEDINKFIDDLIIAINSAVPRKKIKNRNHCAISEITYKLIQIKNATLRKMKSESKKSASE